MRIEYDFTRLDSNVDYPSVCILYIQASGIGGEKFDADICKWRGRRHTPAMSLYFNNMNCYHISYACTGPRPVHNHYVRARRYPVKDHFRDTVVEPSYENIDAFKPGETWHMAFEKVGRQLTRA